jgi:hypothetical protein
VRNLLTRLTATGEVVVVAKPGAGEDFSRFEAGPDARRSGDLTSMVTERVMGSYLKVLRSLA